MSRCVVFQTKGKLDLRSLTVFGMNAKPETASPIGYFGTGLKYAMAVLAHHNIKVEIWVDKKLWVIEQELVNFRGKEFTELYICSTTIGGLIKKRIKLPYTTELGKNWELWQAFRELESNTRDEKGMTFVGDYGVDGEIRVTHGVSPEIQAKLKGWTMIIVQGETFVNEYFNRERTFLPGGLALRESTDRVQAFSSPSKHVYYRGIRVMDLPEPSMNTYNILTQIELTEDRTAKEEFWVKHEIEQFLAHTKDDAVLERAVRAPAKAFERTLFRYSSVGTASEALLDHIDRAGEEAAPEYKELYKKERPPEPPKSPGEIKWITDLRMYISHGASDDAWTIIDEHRNEIDLALANYHALRTREIITQTSKVNHDAVADQIPF